MKSGLVTAFILALCVGTAAASPDVRAPSLGVPADAPVPRYAWALSADPVGMAFGDYRLRLEAALGAHQSLAVAAGVLRGGEGAAPVVEAGYGLCPWGPGLGGPYLGPTLGLWLASQERAEVALGLAGGGAHIWKGLVLGGGAHAGWDSGRGLTFTLRAHVGYAWF